MIVSLLVAMDERNGIGLRGGLPWRLSADLKRFKAITMGHHLLMGRVTWDSIGGVLPGRTMIVITRNPDYHPEGCLVTHSLEEALALVKSRGETEAFVIGGGQIFALALPLADRIYLTRVRAEVEVDVYFPAFDLREWRVVEQVSQEPDEKNQYPFTYYRLHRVTTGIKPGAES